MQATAGESGLILLIGAQGVSENILQQDGRLPANCGRLGTIVARIRPVTGRVASHQAAIVAPVEPDPWPSLPGLVLQVSCLVELFVMVDAEWESVAGRDGRSRASNLGLEEACGHTGENH